MTAKKTVLMRLWVAVLVVNLFVCALVAATLYRSHQRAVAQALVAGGNLAEVLDENLSGVFARIDLALLAVQDELHQQIAVKGSLQPDAVRDVLAHQHARLPEALEVRLIDPQGLVIFPPPGAAATVRVPLMAGTPSLHGGAGTGMSISPPFIGPISGKWVLAFSRPFFSPDGRVAGYIHVPLPIDYLVRKFSSLELGANGSVTLWDRSPAIVARYSRLDQTGQTIGKGLPSQKLRDLLSRETDATGYRAFAGTDRVWRTYGFRRVGTSDLYLVVGLADEDFLADWRHDVVAMSVVCGLFILLTSLGCLVWQRGLRRADSRIVEAQRTLATVNSCNEAIARAGDEISMLESLCRLLVEVGGVSMAWIGRAVEDADHSIELVATYGDHHAYIQNANLSWAEGPQGNGPAGRCLRQRTVCLVDVETDADFAPWRAMAVKNGYRSVLGLPLRLDDQMFGCLLLYAPQTGMFTPDRVDHLSRLADTISYGIHSKRLAGALQSSEALFRSMFERSPQGMVLGSLDGYVVEANDAFLSILGFDRSALVNHDLSLITPAAYEAENDRVLEALMTIGHYGPQDMELRHADGHLVTVRRIALMIRPAEGEKMVWSIIENIAERAAAERSLMERTAELMRSNAELEQFAYVASHDLREPLRMVSSYVSLLERRLGNDLDADCTAFMGFVREGVDRMDRIILDLLDLSRTGRRDAHITHLPLRQVIDQVLLDMTLEGDVLISPGLPVVEGVREELSRLFHNLFSNADKFRSPQRRLSVDISATRHDRMWEIRVRDNGIGIDPQYHDRVFRIFQRLHTRQHYDGNGIGLAICKKIVELHGGRIWVESQPDQGAEFCFTLPAVLERAG